MGACYYILIASSLIQTGRTADVRNNQGLTAVPADLEKTGTIKLMNNSISDVGVGLFPNKARKLFLHQNLLTEVSPNAFCNTVLEQIFLDFNFLTSVPDFTCKSNSLQVISLTGNRLVGHMDSAVLSPYPHLRSVRLGFNNFTSFDRDLFCNFPLDTLNVESNQLTEFPYLGCVADIFLRLVIFNNPICSISQSDIGNFTALMTLGMNGLCLPDLEIILSGNSHDSGCEWFVSVRSEDHSAR